MHLLVLSTILVTAAAPVDIGSDHYEIAASEFAVTEQGRLLDELHGQLSEYFGAAPDGPLRIALFPDRQHFSDALARDGHPIVKGGGYYGPENRTAYLFAQPSVYYTRQLLLHEATHQFHFLVATGNRKPKATWYVEGLADYFAMHDWDGTRLRCGVVPAVSLEDRPAAALATIEENAAHPKWLRRIIDGREKASRPLSWALVHFLMLRDRDAFRRLGARLDQSSQPLGAFSEIIGPVDNKLASEFHRWVAAHQQPWSSVWIEWQQSGEQLEGWAKKVGLLVHKEPLIHLEATIDPDEAHWKAGGVFGYANEKDFYLVQLSSDDTVRILRRTDNRWKAILTTTAEPATRGFSIDRLGGQVTISVNGTRVHEQTAPGKLGLHLDGCRVRFRSTILESEPSR